MQRFIIALLVAMLPLASTHAQQAQSRIIGRIDSRLEYGPALSPNGRYLALSMYDSLLVMEVASGRRWKVLDGQFEYVNWSPKGDMLSFDKGDPEKNTDYIWTLPIDQNTGRPTGEARRVSTTDGDVSAISPDGEWIAFAQYGGNPGQKLVVLPARGGRERVVAEPRAGIGGIVWSDDGKWITYQSNGAQPRSPIVARVAAAGGTPQVIWQSRGPSPEVIRPGGLIVTYHPDRQIRVLDPSGKRTVASLRTGTDLWLTSANMAGTRFYAVADNSPFRLLSVSLTDGSSRLLDTTDEPHGVATRESGGRIVFTRVVDGRRILVASNPDGSDRREYRTQHGLRISGGINARPGRSLSPDGRNLVFLSDDSIPQLVLLDLETGRERVLVPGVNLTGFQWRADGRLLYYGPDSAGGRGAQTVREVTIDGTVRVVRTLVARGLSLLNDTLALSAHRDRLELVPLAGGDPRVIFSGPHTGIALSPDQRFLAVKTVSRIAAQYPNANALAISEGDAVAIVDLRSGQRREVALHLRTPPNQITWHADGRHLVLTMHRPGETRNDLYLVPTNGDPARMIMRGGATAAMRFAALGDGKTILVSVADPITSDLIEFTVPPNSRGTTPRKP